METMTGITEAAGCNHGNARILAAGLREKIVKTAPRCNYYYASDVYSSLGYLEKAMGWFSTISLSIILFYTFE